jgi:hypothetical protein
MKGFAHRSFARTDESHSVREKNGDNSAAASYRAAESESENLGPGRHRPGPRLEYILAMFDSENPERSGDLAGESYASTLENHPRYPYLRSVRDAKLLARLDFVVEHKIRNLAALLLPPLGFDEAGIAVYRSAALSAFRAALPTN